MKAVKYLVSSALLTLSVNGQALAQTVLIKDAKVVTNASRGVMDNADVLIQDGQVSQIRANISAPNGAEVISADGQWVTPGLFAPFSQIGLVEIGAEDSTNDTRSEAGQTSVSDLGVDSFNPKSPIIANTRIEGVTHAAITPLAARNIFGGTGLVADMSGEFDSVEKAQAFVFVQMGSRGASLAGGTRSAAFSQLRAALDDAGAYPARYDGPEDGDTLPRRDAAALAKAARGQMPIMIAADRASDLLRIIDLKNEYGGLDIIVVGAAEGWMVADELVAADIKLIIDPFDNLPGSFDRVGASFKNAKLLADAGAEFAIYSASSGLSHQVRLMPQHAGNAVARGLDWDTAFAAISSVPAGWFGLDSATLDQGSSTLVVWDGDPLEVTSSPSWIMIDGDVQDMNSRQTELRDRYNPTRSETKPHKYR